MATRDPAKQSLKTASDNYVAIIIFRLFLPQRLKEAAQQIPIFHDLFR
jgi:hypothetical protein